MATISNPDARPQVSPLNKSTKILTKSSILKLLNKITKNSIMIGIRASILISGTEEREKGEPREGE